LGLRFDCFLEEFSETKSNKMCFCGTI
jgi:hypothetical protein